MNTSRNKNCAACAGDFQAGAPFCTECGRLSPAVLGEGDIALEIDDAPSERIRHEVVSTLRAWFPQLEPIRAEASLRAGKSILLSGIDEESANRVLEALATFKVRGRSKPVEGKPSWLNWIWNPGLAISAVSLALAAAFGGLLGLLLVVIALGAPVAWALLKGRGKEPLIAYLRVGNQADYWIRLSDEYSEVLGQLAPHDSENLKAFVRKVFRLQKRLESESLASIAAGSDRGDLYLSLNDGISSAVELSRRILTQPEENKGPLREEIGKLNELADRTAGWYRELDGPVIKDAAVLDAELSAIAESIDRIVREVRPLPAVRLTNKEKTSL